MLNTISRPLSNLQKELLKLYAAEIPETHLAHIKNMIALYLWQQAKEEADRVWQEKGYSQETLNQWLHEG